MSFISRFLSIPVLGLAFVAHAGDQPKIVVVPFTIGEGAPDVSVGRFTGQVTEELRTHDDTVDVVGAPAVKAPPGGKSSKPNPEATLALETGKKLLADLKFDEAAPALKKGIELSLQDPATADYPAVLEAQVSLAVAYVRMGDDDSATKTMIALARMDPNYAIPSGYPPAFTREFERAKKKLEKQGKGSLSIEGPPGSTVFVDGRDLGMVPVLEEGLSWGPHYVKLEGSRGERFGQTVEVKGGMLKVKGNFGGASEKGDKGGGVPDPRIAASLDEGTCNRLQAYAKAAGAEYAVVALVYRTGDQQLTAGAALYSAKRNGFAAMPDTSFDADALTSNVEAYKLAEAIVKKVQGFGGSASLPLSLVNKPIVKVGTISASRESDAAQTTRKPKLTPDDNVRALGRKSNLVEGDENGGENKNPPPAVSSGPPKWIWIVVGVAVAAGAGVGGYFAVREATKPVTGTVSATW
jgi:hypothetical protein